MRQRQGDDNAILTGPRGASGAVQVVLVICWRISLQHQGHIIDVDPASRDIRSHQYRQLSGLETLKHARPLRLVEPTV